jgi:hypothetical protein
LKKEASYLNNQIEELDEQWRRSTPSFSSSKPTNVNSVKKSRNSVSFAVESDPAVSPETDRESAESLSNDSLALVPSKFRRVAEREAAADKRSYGRKRTHESTESVSRTVVCSAPPKIVVFSEFPYFLTRLAIELREKGE